MTPTTVSLPVRFDDAGRGEPALVYLSGWCSSRASFAEMTQHTARQRRSLAVDWRGHGTSPAAAGDFGWTEMTSDVLDVLDASGVRTFVPVTNSHAGWVARELVERAPDRVAGVVLMGWLVLGAPPSFAAGLTAMSDLATTRLAAESLTASWVDGHEDVPGLSDQVTAMRRHGDEMWARAGREIAAAYAANPSPLAAFAALPSPPPVRHLYGQPRDESFLAAQQEFASSHPWFTVRRLDSASTHFPMLETPAELARDVLNFTAALEGAG